MNRDTQTEKYAVRHIGLLRYEILNSEVNSITKMVLTQSMRFQSCHTLFTVNSIERKYIL